MQVPISVPSTFYKLSLYDDPWAEHLRRMIHINALRRKVTQPRLTGPVRVLRKILRTWKLDGQAQKVALLLGFDEDDSIHALAILAGRAALKGRDVKDRIVCLYHIRKTLHSLLRNEKVENEWLREQHPGLEGDRPMELMLTGSMENLLLVRDYVETVAGL